MPTLPPDEPAEAVLPDTWEHERAADEACCCAAGQPHADDAPCPRGSRCHCARPIGHPIPVVVSHVRDAPR